ncbi:MAG: hypothetical protein JXA99_00920 [Candidatus Lokiarchaeota archaeon]|nr:hypothetical protein [Candidatus Lokiarchaeota archaeon]
MILFNFAVVNLFFFNSPNNSVTFENDIVGNKDNSTIKTQGDIALLQDPFTTNFKDLWEFFNGNYYINRWSDLGTYFREGDIDGDITSDLIYSLDNMLLYDTLRGNEVDGTEILEFYNQMKATPLWYSGDTDPYDIGFIESVDSSTGVKNYKRNLIDNLIPISLLLDYLPSQSNPTYSDFNSPISEMFLLAISPQFWNDTYQIFMDSNSSSNYFYTESNLYGILTCLEIIQNSYVSSSLFDLAHDYAGNVMDTLMNNLWDDANYGFYNRTAYQSLNPEDENKDLKVNALGIIALVDFYTFKETTPEETHLNNAIKIFEKTDESLYQGAYGLYYSGSSDWTPINNIFDLEANAYMIKACLKLFEATGNITYYERAQDIFEAFEDDFYDDINSGYYKEIVSGTPNTEKNFLSNLRVTEAYLYAVDIYKMTEIFADFNFTKDLTNPKYLFNQDTIKINITYRYNSERFALYNISSADITYVLRYANGTEFYIQHNTTTIYGNHTFYYKIPTTMPIESGYTVLIFANTTYFGMAKITKSFTISSGIEYYDGIDYVNSLYQGQRVNISLRLNNTRKDNINLNFTIESNSIQCGIKEVMIENRINNSTTIWINFTIDDIAEIEMTKFHFILRNGTTKFFDYEKDISIENGLHYFNLLYDSIVVRGDSFFVSVCLTNFLANTTQSFNLTFSGDYIIKYSEELTLDKGETKTFSYELLLSENIYVDKVQLEMNISKSNIVLHNKIVEITVYQEFLILSASFPSSVPQGSSATFLLTIHNNKNIPIGYTLKINGQAVKTNSIELLPGENRIEATITPTINPYDFSTKSYYITLEDNSGNLIVSYYGEVKIELSIMNLVLFYILPILIPIGIVLFFKNKEIKTKLLRR